MEFYHSNLSALETLRTELQLSVNWIWIYVVFDSKTGEGIKLEVKNDFDGILSDKKKAECESIVKGFCEKSDIDYVAATAPRKTPQQIQQEQAAQKSVL